MIAPLSYAGTMRALVRIALIQLFPLRPLQETNFAQALSRNPALKEGCLFNSRLRPTASG